MTEVNKKINILIATGVYPPDLGGPAEYAKNVEKVWREAGYKVLIKTFRLERKMPTGIRHLWYFFKILPAVWKADFVFILDTYSVAFPAILASKIFGKKTIIRIGGDFLWESYVERTGDMIPISEFYKGNFFVRFNFKERIIFKITKWVFKKASVLVWSTDWQREIMNAPYALPKGKNFTVENFYGSKIAGADFSVKNFVWPVRNIKIKNGEKIKLAFAEAAKADPRIILDLETMPFPKLIEKIRKSYAVILPSLSEVSPNLILHAIQYGKPFILTKYSGFSEKLKDIGIFVDPLDEKDIKEKILALAKPEIYAEYQKKVQSFNFTHTWKQISDEILRIYDEVCHN
jgi:hypothetical protein